MSERSIPEILGWEPAGWPHDSGEPMWQHPTGSHVARTAIVDDLIAWLVDRGYVWSGQKFYTGVAVTIAYVETGVEWSPPAFEAPTLLAAFEAAVRAVDANEAA